MGKEGGTSILRGGMCVQHVRNNKKKGVIIRVNGSMCRVLWFKHDGDPLSHLVLKDSIEPLYKEED